MVPWCTVGFAKDIYIVCTHREDVSSSITLSYNDENLKGKEYVGQGTSIPYDVEVTDADIIFNRYNEGKFIRGWNINRYSGNGSLHSTMEGSTKTSYWTCEKATKKL